MELFATGVHSSGIVIIVKSEENHNLLSTMVLFVDLKVSRLRQK